MGRQSSAMKVLLLLFPFVLAAFAERAQVKYLGGITFLLRDRCPEGSSASELSSYDECIENASKGRGQKLQTQCTTDTLRNNDKLTVPLYTDHCSAICFTMEFDLTAGVQAAARRLMRP